MSFDINWNVLSDGEVAESLRAWLNDRFSDLDHPSFIGQLHVNELDFGSTPPSIELLNITDVSGEFYLPDDIDILDPNHVTSLLANPHPFIPQHALHHSHSAEFTASSSSSRDEVEYDTFPLHPHGARSQAATPPQQIIMNSSSETLEEVIDKVVAPMRRETDVQVEILVDYRGNMRLSVSTELIINQPTPKFMVLPLTLTVTGFSFRAVAMISYLGDRINFCFKEPEGMDGLLKDITIESEVGDRGKQVLKNVSKIEKFVVEQIRAVVSNHVVYPNYHCLPLTERDDIVGGVGVGFGEDSSLSSF